MNGLVPFPVTSSFLCEVAADWHGDYGCPLVEAQFRMAASEPSVSCGSAVLRWSVSRSVSGSRSVSVSVSWSVSGSVSGSRSVSVSWSWSVSRSR